MRKPVGTISQTRIALAELVRHSLEEVKGKLRLKEPKSEADAEHHPLDSRQSPLEAQSRNARGRAHRSVLRFPGYRWRTAPEMQFPPKSVGEFSDIGQNLQQPIFTICDTLARQ